MSPEEREEALEAALEALAHGRDDLVPDELRAELEATGATGAVEQAKAASLDLSLLFDAAQPEVDVSALVSAALAAAPRRVLRLRRLWRRAIRRSLRRDSSTRNILPSERRRH